MNTRNHTQTENKKRVRVFIGYERRAYRRQQSAIVTVVSWCPENVKSPQLYVPVRPVLAECPFSANNISLIVFGLSCSMLGLLSKQWLAEPGRVVDMYVKNRSMIQIATTDSSLVITLITHTSLACSKIKDRMQITTRTIVSNVRGEFVYSLINSGRMSNPISCVSCGPLLFFLYGVLALLLIIGITAVHDGLVANLYL